VLHKGAAETRGLAPGGRLFPFSGGTHLQLDTLRLQLGKCVSIGYTATMAGKDAGLRIRVERELRDEFLEICRAQDRPAAQVIREFMRRYVLEHETAREPGRKLPVGRGDQR